MVAALKRKQVGHFELVSGLGFENRIGVEGSGKHPESIDPAHILIARGLECVGQDRAVRIGTRLLTRNRWQGPFQRGGTEIADELDQGVDSHQSAG